MTPEIRRAAIRAAAKAALITAIGCGGDPKPAAPMTPSNVSAAPATKAAVDCATHLGGLAKVKQDKLADDDPLKNDSTVYGQVFADRAARESADTKKCCNEELAANGAGSKLRWECCSALGGTGMACTPWGPPCPPAMPV